MRINIIIYLVLILKVSSIFSEKFNGTDGESISNCTDCNNSRPRTKGEKWIAAEKNLRNMISYATRRLIRIMNPDDINELSPKCFSSLLKIAVGLRQLKMWAFRFIDSMGKIPDGIGNGGMIAMGDFDGCLDINATGSFYGKSCIVELIPPLPEVKPRVGIINDIPELRTAFAPDTLIGGIDAMLNPYYDYFKLKISACVPSTCSEDDVKFMAEKTLKVLSMEWDVRIPICQVKKEIEIEKWDDYTSIFVIGFVVTLVLLGTLLDIIIMRRKSKTNKLSGNSGLPVRIIICFSMYTNTKKLLNIRSTCDSIEIFNGMKVISMLWVILSHTYAFIPPEVMSASRFGREVNRKISFQTVSNGYFAVYTFFFIGGTLLMHSWLKNKQEKIPIFFYIFRRFWRLTPPIMFIAALQLLLYKTGSGPLWQIIFGPFVVSCRERWWANLIYINNFYGTDEACLPWTWYVASDMQLYIISLVSLFTIKKHPKISLITLAALSMTSILAIVWNQFNYEVPPVITALSIRSFSEFYYYVKYGYYRPHMHAIVYFMGMVFGYCVYHKSNIKIFPKVNFICWFLSLISGSVVVYIGYIWYNVIDDPSLTMGAIYNVTGKIVWSLALGWVVISCCTGNGGFATKILSWPVFQPLARLTYVTYLMHPLILLSFYASSKVPLQSDHRTLVFLYLSFVMASFMAAYFLSMLFEAPFMALEKIMFQRRTLNPQEIDKDTDTLDLKEISERNGSIKEFIVRL